MIFFILFSTPGTACFMFLLAVLIVWIGFSQTAKQCSNPQLMQNFNTTAYLGLWYDFAHAPNNF